MRTTLNAETLTALASQGRAQAGRSPFVDPRVVARALTLLRQRGEEWAGSILMRDLSARRSLVDATVPWFEDGEMEALLLADEAEWEQLTKAAGGAR